MLIALIHHTACLVSVFREQQIQDYKINLAHVPYMTITILCQNNKIASHVHIRPVKLVQIAAAAKTALVIKIKTIHAFCLTALVQLASTRTQLSKQIA